LIGAGSSHITRGTLFTVGSTCARLALSYAVGAFRTATAFFSGCGSDGRSGKLCDWLGVVGAGAAGTFVFEASVAADCPQATLLAAKASRKLATARWFLIDHPPFQPYAVSIIRPDRIKIALEIFRRKTGSHEGQARS
jgi:hypothetical protein